ncbi:MAG: hypothetical protein HZB87_00080 [Desulfatitalea sp.]|nr:hypothetical protein [Desulfatitalea sp.]
MKPSTPNLWWKAVHLLAALLLSLFAAATNTWSAESDYHGTYAGTFSGDDSGIWVAVISNDTNRRGFLSYSSATASGDGGDVSFVSETGTEGTYYSLSEFNYSSIYAVIDSSDDTVSGTWENSTESGTLSGSRVTSSAYQGSYSGNFTGDTTGTWQATVASDAFVNGTQVSSYGTYAFIGGVHPNGFLLGTGEGYSGYYFGCGGSGGDGGGGGGGCFIQSLIGD